MKNFGQTIDRLIRVDEGLEPVLSDLKRRWKMRPSKVDLYWKKLMEYLNSEVLDEPKKDRIKEIIIPKPKTNLHSASFHEAHKSEEVLWIIPEHISCKIIKHDMKSIRLARDSTELKMTGNSALAARVLRKSSLLQIASSKIWVELKDHFDLWKLGPDYGIRKNNGILVLVEIKDPKMARGMLPLTPDMLKKMFDPQDENDDD